MPFPNVPTKTLGGTVFWNTPDRRNGWKLQQNMFTQHFRILDPNNVRQAWGDDEGEMWRTFRMFAGSRWASSSQPISNTFT